MGFNLEKDKKAVELLEIVSKPYELPSLKEVVVVGPLASEVDETKTIMAVDGSVRLIDKTPEVLVTDLDGADEEDVKEVLKKGGWVFLHVHGDNYEKAIEVYSKYATRRLIPTVQLLSKRAFCVPALTDGDRALILAAMLSKSFYIIGFGSNVEDDKIKRNVIYPKKRIKIDLSRAYEVIVWERYFGESPAPVTG